jgi:uroporphyrinogen decarboxylase
VAGRNLEVEQMIPRERVLAALDRKPIDRVPFVETTIGIGVGEKLLNRKTPLVSIPQLGLNLRSVEDEKALSRLLHRNNISVRLLAPTFSEKPKGSGSQSFAGDGLIKSMDDFHKRFSLPDPEDPSIYEPIKPFIERKEEFAVICSTRLGFLSALLSIGFQTYMESIYFNPELIDAVMSAYVDWSARVLRRVCDIGVDVVATTDDFAFRTGPFMSPDAFRKWVVPYHLRAIKEIRVPWILHTDGEIHPIVEDLLKMGIRGIHPIDPNCMDIRAFKKEYGKRVCILGNVNVNTLSMATFEETYGEVRDLIRDLAPGYGYMVSSGNSVPDYAKPENMLALARAVEDFGKY